jgi:hypothetical protein
MGRDGFAERFWRGWRVAVNQNLPGLVQEAEAHGAGVPVEATITRVLRGVEAYEASSSSVGCLPNASRSRRYAEGGTSRSIKVP